MIRNTTNSARCMRRRDFLRSSIVLAAAGLGGPYVVPNSVLGQTAPSKRITLGVIGCGNQSTVDLPQWLANDDCQVVAVCDVNKGSHGYRTDKQFLGREPQRDFVNDFYAKKAATGSYKGCDIYSDFRELLARQDIDAVAIIAPDHWHALMTILAARAGKDIYCQKPLTLTVRQGRQMIEAVRQHKRILQTGSQWRSNPLMRHACELVRNGRIGKVQRVETYVAANNFTGPGPGWHEMPVPPGFDYDTWLGPAPKAPYHKDRCFYKFRFILDYSGGQTTNFGCHSNDIAQWGLGTDATCPVEFEDTGSEFPPKGDLFNTPTKVAFRARYASGVVLECKTDPLSFGAKFEGTDGWLRVTSKRLECEPKAVKDSQIQDHETHLYVSANHYRNFLDCVKSRKEPIEPVEIGHHTATLCHLGNISMLLKRKIKWDPEKEEIIGDSEAAGMLARPLRAPWRYDMPLKS
jgi:predicted dehydrogenase